MSNARSVKAFIPVVTDSETDLSEGGLCKERLPPGDVTDQTGVSAIALDS